MEPQHVAISIPINLQIHTISTNSMVNIGQQNITVGVSHSSKENTGFGSVSGERNFVCRTNGFVYDPDYIDHAVDDRDVKVLANFAPTVRGNTNILFQSMAVNTMTQNAGVFIGESRVAGFDSHEKDNIGYGKTYGHGNVHSGNVGMNYDPDQIDMIINDQDLKMGVSTNV